VLAGDVDFQVADFEDNWVIVRGGFFLECLNLQMILMLATLGKKWIFEHKYQHK
jgi:hypothetical protein